MKGATKQAKTEYVAVKMTDGREVQFPTKRKMQREVLMNGEGVTVRFDYINGETRSYKVPEQHFNYAAGFGFGHKLGGRLAGVKENEDVEDSILAIDNLYDRLAGSNDWNEVALGGEATGGNIILLALMKYTGKTYKEAKDYVDSILQKAKDRGEELSRQTLYTDFRRNERLKPIIRQLEDEKAAKATPTIVVDTLLDDFATA